MPHHETARLREALVESERLAELGRMSAIIAHEIKTPLQALSNALYLLEQHCPVDEEAKRYLEIARQELRRAIEIAKQTLGFVRVLEKPIDVNVTSILEEILKFYAHKIRYKEIKIATDLRSEARVSAFPGQVRQIFSNLVINALEAVEPGRGRIAIRCRQRHRRAVPGIQVTIADNGMGMPATFKTKLFQPFFTTKGKGTGLGLWLTRELIEKHHGKIRLRSNAGPERHGVCVSVFLPQDAESNLKMAA